MDEQDPAAVASPIAPARPARKRTSRTARHRKPAPAPITVDVDEATSSMPVRKAAARKGLPIGKSARKDAEISALYELTNQMRVVAAAITHNDKLPNDDEFPLIARPALSIITRHVDIPLDGAGGDLTDAFALLMGLAVWRGRISSTPAQRTAMQQAYEQRVAQEAAGIAAEMPGYQDAQADASEDEDEDGALNPPQPVYSPRMAQELGIAV